MIRRFEVSPGPPLEPSAEQARRWAQEELAKREYRSSEGASERILAWLRDLLNPYYERLGSAGSPSSAIASTVLVILVVIALVWAINRFGMPALRGSSPFDGGVFEGGDAARTAQEHRDAASAAERNGEYSAAVMERFRAIARELEQRAVLIPQPGRTASEIARQAGTSLPAVSARLAGAATLFDSVCYGRVQATPNDSALLREVDAEVSEQISAQALETAR